VSAGSFDECPLAGCIRAICSGSSWETSSFWRDQPHITTNTSSRPLKRRIWKLPLRRQRVRILLVFDQWVCRDRLSEICGILNVAGYDWHALLHVTQTQNIDSLTAIPYACRHRDHHIRRVSPHRVTINSGLSCSRLPSRPRMVLFDKGNWLLKELAWRS
jgi:hypothetical protein